jgi:hypothetical protein
MAIGLAERDFSVGVTAAAYPYRDQKSLTGMLGGKVQHKRKARQQGRALL